VKNMMKRTIQVLFVLALLTGVCLADEPKVLIRGQRVIPVGSMCVLDARDSVSDSDQPLQWEVMAPADFSILTADKGPRLDVFGFFLVDKPGTYRIAVTAFGTVGGKLRGKTSVYEVTTNGAPTPGPGPGPNPPPPPPPPTPALVGNVWATAVFDVNAMTMDMAVLNLGADIRKAAKENNIFYRVLYSDDPQITEKNLTRYFSGDPVKNIPATKLPAIVIQDSTGKVVPDERAIEMKDQASVANLFKQLRGK
jgi:hypothetical protein